LKFYWPQAQLLLQFILTYLRFNGSLDIVKALLALGVDVNEVRRSGTNTALHAAIEEGHLSIAEVLLDAGADIQAPGEERITPVRLASPKGDKNMIDLLLKRGGSKRRNKRSF
jgi:ankyrin repeat protein